MKNKLIDLNDHLFAQLERLNDEDLTSEELEKEIVRSKVIVGVANSIIHNASVVLEGQKHMDEYGYKDRDKSLPIMLQNGTSKHES